MPNYTYEQLQERFKSLPEAVQDALTSVETVSIMTDIESKYKLHIDQIGVLAEEAGALMLGFSKPADFIPTIALKMRISQIQARTIASELNEKLFGPIKEHLKDVHHMGNSEKKDVSSGLKPDGGVTFDQKMSGLFTSTPKTNISNPAVGPVSRIGGVDPYREAVE
jgi:hypothetical protein